MEGSTSPSVVCDSYSRCVSVRIRGFCRQALDVQLQDDSSWNLAPNFEDTHPVSRKKNSFLCLKCPWNCSVSKCDLTGVCCVFVCLATKKAHSACNSIFLYPAKKCFSCVCWSGFYCSLSEHAVSSLILLSFLVCWAQTKTNQLYQFKTIRHTCCCCVPVCTPSFRYVLIGLA